MSAFLDENGKLVTVSADGRLPVDGTTQQLPSSLGIKTSANSLSVTPASDAVTVVSGYAADGAAATNPSVLIGAKTPEGLKKTLTVDTAGLYTRNMLIDTTGAYGFSPDYCSCVNTYNTDGTINYVTYTDPITNYSFRRTYTWTSGKITSFTGWVKQ